jgi:hypothetical protein
MLAILLLILDNWLKLTDVSNRGKLLNIAYTRLGRYRLGSGHTKKWANSPRERRKLAGVTVHTSR